MAVRTGPMTTPFLTRAGGAAAAGLLLGLTATAGLAATPDAAHGAALYAGQCAVCHGAQGGGGQGPALRGVVGRKAASTDYAYSAALKATGWTWTDAHLNAYLQNPQAAVPGTLMPAAVTSAADRADIAAFLATLKLPASPPERAAATGRQADAGPPSVFGDWRRDAPGTVHRITVADLPRPFASGSANNRSHRAPRPAGALPQAPAGFTVSAFASGLENPRALRVAPDGDVFLAETAAGRIKVLRAARGAPAAEQVAVFTEGLTGPFGMALYPAGPHPKWLYVAERNRVVRFAYTDGRLKAEGPPEVVVAQLAPTSNGHTTRDIAFSPDGRRMFVSVGSGSNVAEEMPRRPLAESRSDDAKRGLGVTWGPEENRADVLVFTPEGRDGRVFASGIRNCVGLAVQPGRGDLWCSVNERDELGDNLVPDYVTRVKAGAFYGWPWWWLGSHQDPRLPGERPDLAGKVTVPDVLIQPHSAPLQMAFYPRAVEPGRRADGRLRGLPHRLRPARRQRLGPSGGRGRGGGRGGAGQRRRLGLGLAGGPRPDPPRPHPPRLGATCG